ncbi:right-handed parallel beta-helix repeat-containing protein [Lentzea sp. JNUCC 0626]|uniref:right-handed parallel beta-helix repeat-containing protein n=1 Tax=Lentzea sp. JNUCC 0626 TaxID=3367513 RepID=UPI00374803E4
MRLISAFAVLIALFGSVTPAQAVAIPQCGQVVTTTFTLMGDWGCGNGPALIVGANGVKIDLKGHTLSGTPAIDMSNFDGTVVRDGAITSTITAVNATNVRFVDMTIGWSDSSAVYDWPGSTVTFLRSRLTMWRLYCGEHCHLLHTSASMNQIGAQNLILQGGQPGSINFIGAVNLDLINSKVRPLTVGGSERLTIRGSEMPGFEVIATGRIELLNNTFTGGNWVGVHRPVSGVIRGNTFRMMKSHGLFVQPKDTLNGPLLIERNTFTENAKDGLRVDIPIPLDITVRKNRSEHSRQYGMWATEGSVVDGGGNVSHNDALGCFTITCSAPQGE